MFVEAFLVFDQKFSKRQKHTKLSSDRHILLFGSVCLQYVCLLSLSFRSSSRRQQRDDLVSAFVSSRVVAIGAKRLLVLAGKEVERLYSFCAPKKESSFLPPLRLLLCDLFFVITTYELYSRGLRFFSFSFVLLLPSRGSNRRVVVVGRSRLLLLFLLLSFTHTRSLSSLLKNRHLLEASIDHFSKQKTHNLFSYIF